MSRLQLPADRLRTAGRRALIALGVLALLAAMWAGLVRLGWPWPRLSPALPGDHGPLMVAGFLGTVIGVERAVAIGRRGAYAAPLLGGLGALGLALGLPRLAGAAAITLGSLGLVLIFGVILRRQTALFTGTMALGAVVWLAGNLLWLSGRSIDRIVLWWAAFLVLTIAGERLELSRLLRLTAAKRLLFLLATALLCAGLLLSLVAYDAGARLVGLGLLGLALWMLRYDIARRTVRKEGLTRYIAANLLLGYGWLLAGGLMALGFGGVVSGPRYDMLLHTIFLGFVFSMIFAHAPIIVPAVSGLAVPYRPIFYLHGLLLHLSLVLRVGSDLAGWVPGRQWGGLLNVIALLVFLGSSALAIRAGRARKGAATPSGLGSRREGGGQRV